MTTTTRGRTAPKGSVNLSVDLSDLRYSVTQTRANFTQVRGFRPGAKPNRQPKADFITFLSLACEMYRDHGDELVPIQQYTPELETYQGKGHTSLVTHFQLSQLTRSDTLRGATTSYQEAIVIKRPRYSILEERSEGLVSFITELRVRNHAPLRSNPHIATLRGIGWDFEDPEGTIPRPILLEELAPQGAMDNLWKHWNFVRMTFKSRLELCRSIADGLNALHLCGVVHGDVKPENILVFPRNDRRDAFMVKLTDFGHSVLEQDGLEGLPAFTPLWCAPEATQKASMTFQDMVATDCYSYGLVVLSIMIGRAFYSSFDDVEGIKADGSILERSIALVEREDKESNDSDLEVDIVTSLLRKSLRLDPKSRSLRHCITIIDRYERRNGRDSIWRKRRPSNKRIPLPRLNVAGKVDIGYQSLRLCSHAFKAYVVEKLLAIANDTTDRRRAAAAWELTICYFSGFGVTRCFEDSSRWLTVAASHGSVAAQEYFNTIHEAMGIDLKSITRSASDVKSSWSSTTAADWGPSRILPPPKELGATPVAGEAESSDSGSYLSGSEDENAEQAASTVMPSHVAGMICNGSVDEVRQLLQDDLSLLTRRDSEGNTPLLVAVKSNRYEMVDLILDFPSVDAGICNRSGQCALHYLPGFADHDIRCLVPRLIEQKADPNAECLSTPRDGSVIGIAANIRSCSILNAILHNNLTLLQCLLEAGHSSECISACRVCEAGSAFRRMLAVSLSFFQADALEILIAHVRAHRGDHVLELDKIEVWAGQELLPLHKVPFHSIAVAIMDLPESFFRALVYGSRHVSCLRRTIEFLMDAGREPAVAAYSMLKSAVGRNSVDGVRLLFEVGALRQLPKSWWIQPSKTKGNLIIYTLPIMEAIHYGLREIYDLLSEQDKSMFTEEYVATCAQSDCRLHQPRWKRKLFGLLGISVSELLQRQTRTHTHSINMVRYALEIAVMARHQDLYFIDTLLSTVNEDLVGDIWATSALADTILKSFFKAAELIAGRFPKLWTTSMIIQARSQMPIELIRRYIDSEDVLRIQNGTVVEAVLYEGSYEQVQFVLKALRSWRKPNPRPWPAGQLLGHRQWKRNTPGDVPSQWQQGGVLLRKEYHALLTGNIRRVRDDREPLWSVIAQEADSGHSKSTSYLYAAIRYCNTEALGKMLELGWKANLPLSFLRGSPLQLVNFMLEEAKEAPPQWKPTPPVFDMLQRISGPMMAGNMRETSQSYLYTRYWDTQNQLFRQFWKKKLEEIRDVLISHGALASRYLTMGSFTVSNLAVMAYIAVYALFLPLLLVYATEDVWTSMTRSQKLGFMYSWSLIATLLPAIPLVTKGPPNRFQHGLIIWYATCGAFFLVNHIVLPVLVIHHNWRPFLSCRLARDCKLDCDNFTFLLPLVLGAMEYVLGSILYELGDFVDFW